MFFNIESVLNKILRDFSLMEFMPCLSIGEAGFRRFGRLVLAPLKQEGSRRAQKKPLTRLFVKTLGAGLFLRHADQEPLE